MTREEEIKYLKIALNIQGINISERIADQVIETFEAVKKKKGNFSVNDAVGIELKVERKYKEIEVKARKNKE